MLARLYDLPPASPEIERLNQAGITCRRAESFERSAVAQFVRTAFPHWLDELLVAFSHVPIGVFVAIERSTVLGFACIDATRPDFFGPTGVDPARRGEGMGKALLLLALEALHAQGYAYAIIGGVGPATFYEHCAGATLIEGSDPGIYGERALPESRSTGQ